MYFDVDTYIVCSICRKCGITSSAIVQYPDKVLFAQYGYVNLGYFK